MIFQRLHERIRGMVKILQHHVDRLWYAPFLGFLAGLDNLVVVVPTDGILISSTILKPRRWLILAFSVAFGSTLGALALAAVVEFQGLPWILEHYPGLQESSMWLWTEEFFKSYGLLVVFGVAVTPLMQQPAVILASLANTSFAKLAIVIFSGRLIKYLFMAYLASHAPKVLGKLWGIKGELKDAGVELK